MRGRTAYLRSTVAVVNAEEVNGRDLAGGFGARSRTSSDAIAGEGHKPWNNSNSVLHLLPPSNHRRKSPTNSLVVPSDALVPPRPGVFRGERSKQLRRRHCIGDHKARNVAGAGAEDGNVAGAGGAAGIFGAEYEGSGSRTGSGESQLGVDSVELQVVQVQPQGLLHDVG